MSRRPCSRIGRQCARSPQRKIVDVLSNADTRLFTANNRILGQLTQRRAENPRQRGAVSLGHGLLGGAFTVNVRQTPVFVSSVRPTPPREILQFRQHARNRAQRRVF